MVILDRLKVSMLVFEVKTVKDSASMYLDILATFVCGRFNNSLDQELGVPADELSEKASNVKLNVLNLSQASWSKSIWAYLWNLSLLQGWHDQYLV